MKRTLTLGVVLFSLLSPLGLRGEESKGEKSKLDLTQRYLLLDTHKGSTLQQEVNEAAAAGYRVRFGASYRTADQDTSILDDALFSFRPRNLLLEKTAHPPDTYEYLIEGGGERGGLNEAAVKGFRLLPLTEGVMEKAPGSKTRYQYLVLSTQRNIPFASRTGHLQEKLTEASQQGYEVVAMEVGGMWEQAGDLFVILEKTLGTGNAPTPQPVEKSTLDRTLRYRLLATTKTSTMQKEMERAPGSQNRFQYLLLATGRASTMRKELAQASQQGYDVVGISMKPLPPATACWSVRPLKRFY